MPRGKVRINAPPQFAELLAKPAEGKPAGFSQAFRNRLRSFYRESGLEANSKRADWDKVLGSADESFAAEIIMHGAWAKEVLADASLSLERKDIEQERAALLKSLLKARHILRHMSPDVERILPSDALPLELADAIEPWLSWLDLAKANLAQLPRKPTPPEIGNSVAQELTLRVLRTAKRYGLGALRRQDKRMTSFDPSKDPLVMLMDIVGREIRLRYSPMTWFDFIRRSASDKDLR